MSQRAASFLLALVVVAACSGTDATVTAREGAREPAPRNAKTAPAGGLWSHRFVRWRDGTITAVGFSRQPAGIGLVRYLPSGVVDRSFQRIVHREFGAGKLDALAAVRGGPDSVVVAACQPPDCAGYFVLGRFRRDGSLDPTFGDRGVVRSVVPAGSIEPRALAVQPDGSILVAGELSKPPSRQGFLARYLPDGTNDPSFGRGGLVRTEIEAIAAIAVQADGRIVAAGHRLNPTTRPASSNVEIARYLADGRIDAGFGTGGVARVAALLFAETVVIDPHRRIVVAGSARRGYRPFFAIARLTARGTLDRAFSRDGHVLYRRPGDHASAVEALTPLNDGSLVATGWATRGGAVPARRQRVVVLVLQPSGALVRRFGDGGRLTVAGVVGRGQATFQTSRRRLLVVGADDDLEPKRVVFAPIQLPLYGPETEQR
jgi:uncharacterized delta-60 repeat protein